MSTDDEIKKLQEKHRKQLADNRQKLLARKARTRRLIQRGAIAEAFIINADQLTNDEFMAALKKLISRS